MDKNLISFDFELSKLSSSLINLNIYADNFWLHAFRGPSHPFRLPKLTKLPEGVRAATAISVGLSTSELIAKLNGVG